MLGVPATMILALICLLGGDARCRVSLAGSSFDKLNIGLSKDVMVSLSNHESELTRDRTP